MSIAVPNIQDELSLSGSGIQWVINGYLLALSAFFALGGRLADILGHRRMVLLGVVIFAVWCCAARRRRAASPNRG